jgi:predicted  nucleic acid-binding Zn-ribbon protein
MSMLGRVRDAGSRMATAVEQSVQQSIVEATADVREVKEQLKGANGDEKVALQQRLAALEQRLAALEQRLATLEQQKLLLMQQQSGATGLGTQHVLQIASLPSKVSTEQVCKMMQ